jgi:hypothetical protein
VGRRLRRGRGLDRGDLRGFEHGFRLWFECALGFRLGLGICLGRGGSPWSRGELQRGLGHWLEHGFGLGGCLRLGREHGNRFRLRQGLELRFRLGGCLRLEFGVNGRRLRLGFGIRIR